MTWPWIVALVVAQLTLFFTGRSWERLSQRRAMTRLIDGLDAGARKIAAREHPGSELPARDVWPQGFNPNAHLGAERRVELKNGHGGALVLKVRGGAFRVVSFTRPTKFDPVSGEGDTTDLWLNVEDLVQAVKYS